MNEELRAGDRVRVVAYNPTTPAPAEHDPNGLEGVVVDDPDPYRQLALLMMGMVLVDLGPEHPTTSGRPHWILSPNELERV